MTKTFVGDECCYDTNIDISICYAQTLFCSCKKVSTILPVLGGQSGKSIDNKKNQHKLQLVKTFKT